MPEYSNAERSVAQRRMRLFLGQGVLVTVMIGGVELQSCGGHIQGEGGGFGLISGLVRGPNGYDVEVAIAETEGCVVIDLTWLFYVELEVLVFAFIDGGSIYHTLLLLSPRKSNHPCAEVDSALQFHTY